MAQAQLLRAVIARVLPVALGALGAGLFAGLAAPLGAQRAEDLDLARIRARAATQAPDAEAFARAISRRGDALKREARVAADTARTSLDRPKATVTDAAATFDFDTMVKIAGAGGEADAAPRLIAFASLSMPAAALRRMIEDVGRAGGAVVFRGLPSNSARVFTAALSEVLPSDQARTSIGIDPRLFRAFDIRAVPTYVVTGTAVDLCDGLECRSAPPPHDVVRGNVTLAHALRTFSEGRGPGARAADGFRRRLEASR